MLDCDWSSDVCSSDLPKHVPHRPAGLAEPVQAHLGEKLKEFYGSILREPVPDRLTALLDELEKQERAALAAQAKGGDE
jgi:hypothetical protein